MDLNSRLFDRIRVKPRGARTAGAASATRTCDHPGCASEGAFRAPKGRAHEGQFFHFCIDHVREYNQSYNYFAGMKDEAVAAYQKDAVTGHRPTWRMGTAAGAAGAAGAGPSTRDPFDVLGGGGFDPRRRARPPEESGPSVSHAARKAMETLGVDPGTPGPEIKSLYKTLVKRLHPDANGGDRSNEDRLREIINAYNHLRAAGLV